jgi:hypothetical protein
MPHLADHSDINDELIMVMAMAMTSLLSVTRLTGQHTFLLRGVTQLDGDEDSNLAAGSDTK